jgi:hypothetical protein
MCCLIDVHVAAVALGLQHEAALGAVVLVFWHMNGSARAAGSAGSVRVVHVKLPQQCRV